jgi:hypothetical protein
VRPSSHDAGDDSDVRDCRVIEHRACSRIRVRYTGYNILENFQLVIGAKRLADMMEKEAADHASYDIAQTFGVDPVSADSPHI